MINRLIELVIINININIYHLCVLNFFCSYIQLLFVTAIRNKRIIIFYTLGCIVQGLKAKKS